MLASRGEKSISLEKMKNFEGEISQMLGGEKEKVGCRQVGGGNLARSREGSPVLLKGKSPSRGGLNKRWDKKMGCW